MVLTKVVCMSSCIVAIGGFKKKKTKAQKPMPAPPGSAADQTLGCSLWQEVNPPFPVPEPSGAGLASGWRATVILLATACLASRRMSRLPSKVAVISHVPNRSALADAARW
jgi:hypothetical protein